MGTDGGSALSPRLAQEGQVADDEHQCDDHEHGREVREERIDAVLERDAGVVERVTLCQRHGAPDGGHHVDPGVGRCAGDDDGDDGALQAHPAHLFEFLADLVLAGALGGHFVGDFFRPLELFSLRASGLDRIVKFVTHFFCDAVVVGNTVLCVLRGRSSGCRHDGYTTVLL